VVKKFQSAEFYSCLKAGIVWAVHSNVLWRFPIFITFNYIEQLNVTFSSWLGATTKLFEREVNFMTCNMIKSRFKKKLNFRHYTILKRIYLGLLSIPFSNNLNMLARIYKCDKFGRHFYTKHYQFHFKKFRFKRIRLFEIGVGGYHYPNMGGNSLRMWKRYFPFGRIYSLDIYDKSFLEERRIRIYQGSQVDEDVLIRIFNQIGEPDIIIDDGSHINEHVITTFQYLFPKLKIGGIYVIEDVQTSYWPDYGGDSHNLNNPSTIMNYFKNLTDCTNYQEFLNADYKPSYYDENIVSIQFYHNLIFIYKGENNEGSNIDITNPESVLADKIYI
jgi:demethylmacrocin O-methyltransferase